MLNVHKFLGCVALIAAAMLSLDPVATQAAIIAHWRFEPGDFLADSSGNGHTLANSGATSTTDSPGGFSGGSALFDGTNDIMSTVGNLDLASYSHVRVTWWMRVQSTSGVRAVFEHSTNKNNNPGGFVATVHEYNATTGLPAIHTTSSNNADRMPHSIPGGGNPNGVWEEFRMDLDLNASGGGLLETYRGGVPSPDSPSHLDSNLSSFLSGHKFFIGARSGPAILFQGNIDELKIESVPEPSSLLLLVLGAGGVGMIGFRRR